MQEYLRIALSFWGDTYEYEVTLLRALGIRQVRLRSILKNNHTLHLIVKTKNFILKTSLSRILFDFSSYRLSVGISYLGLSRHKLF